jgi:hypothetical protein
MFEEGGLAGSLYNLVSSKVLFLVFYLLIYYHT